MGEIMTDSEKLRRFGLDKTAFFLLLLAGLFLAKLIISRQTDFKPSEPVALQGCGLAVSVPAGGGFKRLSDGFEYNDNEFRFSCILQINSDSAVSVQWRYFLLPMEKTASERFEIKAASIQGHIESTGADKFGNFTFDYAKIISEKTAAVLFCGTTQLPDGRTLTLDVAQKGQNIDLAEKIFNSLAASVTFTPDNPLAKGAELLNNFRSKDLAAIVQKKARQNYYYIKNYTNQSMGFVTDALGFKADSNAGSFAAASLYLVQSGAIAFAEQSLFVAEPNMQTFKWASFQSDLSINRNSATSIELDRQGLVTVQKQNVVQNFALTSTMLPEIILDVFINSFLQSTLDSVMIDAILSDGRIKPVLIVRTAVGKNSQINAASAVETVFFGADKSQQTTYFDDDGKILLGEMHGRISYKLENAERERLITDFPAWDEKIRQIGQQILDKPDDKEQPPRH